MLHHCHIPSAVVSSSAEADTKVGVISAAVGNANNVPREQAALVESMQEALRAAGTNVMFNLNSGGGRYIYKRD